MDRANRRHSGGALAAAALLALLLGGASGCYTMLRHPSPDEGFAAEEDLRCQRCHDASLEDGGDASSWIDYYAYSTSPWLNYYASPWWYDTEWVLTPISPPAHAYEPATGPSAGSPPPRHAGDDSEASDGGRLTWGRRLLADEPSPHDQMERTTSSSAPIVTAPSPTPSSGPSGPPVTVTRDRDAGNQTSAGEKKKENRGKKGRAIRR